MVYFLLRNNICFPDMEIAWKSLTRIIVPANPSTQREARAILRIRLLAALSTTLVTLPRAGYWQGFGRPGDAMYAGRYLLLAAGGRGLRFWAAYWAVTPM